MIVTLYIKGKEVCKVLEDMPKNELKSKNDEDDLDGKTYEETDLHHILGRDERYKLILKKYNVNLLKYTPFMIELSKKHHAEKSEPKTRKQIIQWVYDTQGEQGLLTLIAFARELGTYPLELIDATDLLLERS